MKTADFHRVRSNAWLSYKFLNVLNGEFAHFFFFFQTFGKIMAKTIPKILFLQLWWLWIFAAISQPAAAQEKIVESVQVPAESFISILMPGISTIEDFVDLSSLNNLQVPEFLKVGVEGGTEVRKGISKTFSMLGIQNSENTNQSSQNSKRPDREILDKIAEIIQAILLGLFFSMLPLYAALMDDKPNQ